METKNNKGVFFENGTWNFMTKAVNRTSYTIEYEKRSGFASMEEAERAEEQEKERYQKQIARVKSLTNMRFTFFEYLDYWFQNIYLPNCDGSTKVSYSWTIYQVILPKAGKDILIGMVTSDYLNEILENCSVYCQSAGPMVYKVLHVILKDAIADEYITTDPFPAMKKYYFDVPPTIVYSKEQIKTLLQAAYEYHSIYLKVLLALFAGLRTGEILGLKYSDFDPKQQTVKIERQIVKDHEIIIDDHGNCKRQNKEKVLKPPKSLCSYRTLRVHKLIFQELEIRRKENMQLFEKLGEEEQTWKDYISIGPKGNIKSNSTCNCALIRICDRNSLPRISMHDLRHLFATILIEEGMPLETISKALGHKSVSTTFEVYCGVIAAKEKITTLIDSSFDPINAAAKTLKGGCTDER